MKPLTIEQLRSLEAGDWVWLEIKDKQSLYVKKCEARSENGFNFTADFVVAIALYSDYGTKWLAYKNKEQAEAKSEIVELPCRCKDCVFYKEAHYEDEGEEPYIKHVCRFLHRQILPYDFCSCAKRRLMELTKE